MLPFFCQMIAPRLGEAATARHHSGALPAKLFSARPALSFGGGQGSEERDLTLALTVPWSCHVGFFPIAALSTNTAFRQKKRPRHPWERGWASARGDVEGIGPALPSVKLKFVAECLRALPRSPPAGATPCGTNVAFPSQVTTNRAPEFVWPLCLVGLI
jgi:hypothetical protein